MIFIIIIIIIIIIITVTIIAYIDIFHIINIAIALVIGNIINIAIDNCSIYILFICPQRVRSDLHPRKGLPGYILLSRRCAGANGIQGTFSAVLYHTVLHCTVLHCTVLYCTVLYCTVLHCTVLCSS